MSYQVDFIHLFIEQHGNPTMLIDPLVAFRALDIPAGYTKRDAELTGFLEKPSFNDPRILEDIRNYRSSFDRQAYVDAHAELFPPPRLSFDGLWMFDLETISYRNFGGMR